MDSDGRAGISKHQANGSSMRTAEEITDSLADFFGWGKKSEQVFEIKKALNEFALAHVTKAILETQFCKCEKARAEGLEEVAKIQELLIARIHAEECKFKIRLAVQRGTDLIEGFKSGWMDCQIAAANIVRCTCSPHIVQGGFDCDGCETKAKIRALVPLMSKETRP